MPAHGAKKRKSRSDCSGTPAPGHQGAQHPHYFFSRCIKSCPLQLLHTMLCNVSLQKKTLLIIALSCAVRQAELTFQCGVSGCHSHT